MVQEPGAGAAARADTRQLRRWLRVPAGHRLPGWAKQHLAAGVAQSLSRRRGRSLERCVFGILDVETTGSSPKRDRIAEVGLVVLQGGRVRRRFGSFVDPEGRPSRADPEALAQAPGEAAVVAGLRSLLVGEGVEVLVAHNAGFDRGFLEAAWRRHAGDPPLPEFLCTLRLARRWIRAPSHSLDSLVSQLAIPRQPRHRALADAEMTAALLSELLARARLDGVHTLEALAELARPARTPRPRRVRVVDAPPTID